MGKYDTVPRVFPLYVHMDRCRIVVYLRAFFQVGVADGPKIAATPSGYRQTAIQVIPPFPTQPTP